MLMNNNTVKLYILVMYITHFHCVSTSCVQSDYFNGKYYRK